MARPVIEKSYHHVEPTGLAFLSASAYSLVLPARWYLGVHAKDDELAKGATDALADALESKLTPLRETAWPSLPFVEPSGGMRQYGWSEEHGTTVPIDELDGMLFADARFAEFLEGLGENGRKAGDELRAKARERWSQFKETGDAEPLWHVWKRTSGPSVVAYTQNLTDVGRVNEWMTRAYALDGSTEEFIEPEGLLHTAPRFVITLAHVLWHDVVRPKLDRARRKPPALVRAVHQSAMEFHSRVPKYDVRNRTLSFEGRALARLYGSFDVDVIERGLSILGSVAAHKLFRWEVITGHDQALRNVPNPHIIDVEGGWSALAQLLGLDPGRPNMTANLRAILHAQRSFQFTFPDGSQGNMLVLNERPAKGGQKAHLRIELGTVLLPDYVHALPKGSPERKLVPLLREPIPLHGRPNEHGQQLTMSLAVLAELRARAAELAEQGGVTLSHTDWTRLADRSGIKRSMIIDVRDKWIAGDGARAAPFLSMTKPDRYTLADAHKAERDFLIEAGRDELSGSKAGQKGATKRRAKLRRVGK